MKRYQRTYLILEYGRSQALTWGEQIAKAYSYEMIVKPHLGLVMLKHRESALKTLFYSGEMLMSECKVRFNECIGCGLVAGENLDLSLAMALIDLAYQAQWAICQEMDQWLLDLQAKAQEKEQADRDLYHSTRVNFSTMKQ